MLVPIRNEGEKVFIGDDIVIKVVETHKGCVKLGIEAPADTSILRDDAIKKEPRKDK